MDHSSASSAAGVGERASTLRYRAAVGIDSEMTALAAQGVRFVPADYGRWRVPYNRASDDYAVLDAWAERWPRTDWLATTSRSGLALIVVEHGADLGLVERELGALPPTVTSRSPRESQHRWFKATDVASHVFSPGVSLRRGSSCGVAVPPSLHSQGGAYVWEPSRAPSEIAMAELPVSWRLASALPQGRA